MSAINLSTYGDTNGAMLAMQARRQQKETDRVDAVRMGQGVQNQDQLETKVRQVAEDFVGVFMNQVMKSMRSTVQENPMMHGDNGEKFFQEMLDTEQSKQLAKGSGYGLTDLIYESMMASYRVQRPDGAAAATDSKQEADFSADLEAASEPDAAVEGIA